MEITDVSVAEVSTESWGEFVEFPLATVMSQHEGYNGACGDNPEARREWMGPIGDVVIETDAMDGAHDVPAVSHSGKNPPLHFIAASSNTPMVEYFPIPEWYTERQEERDSTYADAIYAGPPDAENGTLPFPDGVGLSSELNREALERELSNDNDRDQVRIQRAGVRRCARRRK